MNKKVIAFGYALTLGLVFLFQACQDDPIEPTSPGDNPPSWQDSTNTTNPDDSLWNDPNSNPSDSTYNPSNPSDSTGNTGDGTGGGNTGGGNTDPSDSTWTNNPSDSSNVGGN